MLAASTRARGGRHFSVYDPASRVLCTVLRMDGLSSPGSLLTGCAPPQTTGANGSDRVTHNHYDALGRVWKVTTAYGLASPQPTDEAISTFTANGQLETLTDAEGNMTTYEYDGHDRRVKTYFPVGTKGAGSSNSLDYEQVGYDANGNVTSFRTRRGADDDLRQPGPADHEGRADRAGLDATHERDVYFSYDLFGNMTDARFDNVSGHGIANTFDALGQLAGTTTSMDGISRSLSYQYDVAGNRIQLNYPGGTGYVHYYRHGSGAMRGRKYARPWCRDPGPFGWLSSRSTLGADRANCETQLNSIVPPAAQSPECSVLPPSSAPIGRRASRRCDCP